MKIEAIVGILFTLYVIGVGIYFLREISRELSKIGKKLESPRAKRVIEGVAGLGIASWAFRKAGEAKSPEEVAFYRELARGGVQMASQRDGQKEPQDPANWWKESKDDGDEEPPAHNRFGQN